MNQNKSVEEVVDLVKSYARQYYLTAEENDSEENLKKKEEEIRSILQTSQEREREIVEVLIKWNQERVEKWHKTCTIHDLDNGHFWEAKETQQFIKNLTNPNKD